MKWSLSRRLLRSAQFHRIMESQNHQGCFLLWSSVWSRSGKLCKPAFFLICCWFFGGCWSDFGFSLQSNHEVSTLFAMRTELQHCHQTITNFCDRLALQPCCEPLLLGRETEARGTSMMLRASKSALGWDQEIRRHQEHKPQAGKRGFSSCY